MVFGKIENSFGGMFVIGYSLRPGGPEWHFQSGGGGREELPDIENKVTYYNITKRFKFISPSSQQKLVLVVTSFQDFGGVGGRASIEHYAAELRNEINPFPIRVHP